MTKRSEPDENDALTLDAFDFELPERLIALRPAAPRSAARLLVSTAEALTDAVASALPNFLRRGDRLVFNDTRVLPARLTGVRRRAASDVAVEATLIEERAPDLWAALARPGRRLRIGDEVRFGPEEALAAIVVDKEPGGAALFRFDRAGPALAAAIAAIGAPPLPPYIAQRRAADARDAADYQTVFAAADGAVAAPTAALHFDAALLAALDAAEIGRTTVTLHVGAGTFLPIKSDRIADHRMHAERGALSETAAREIRDTARAGGRIVAVGTTSLRVLETAALAGETDAAGLAPWSGATELYVRPGFRFRVVDGLMTNFHLPKSTLLLLVAAFIGRERLFGAYAHAIREGYRFYSYGDASLLWPTAPGSAER